MIYNFEYELKLMLSESEYEDLLMLKGCDAFKQTNYYFDTDDFDCYKQKNVIRIRVKEEINEITVKTKKAENSKIGVLAMNELNKTIDDKTARALIVGDTDIVEHISENISVFSKKLSCIGKITTIRKKICINEGLVMAELDKSIYNGKTDFELEWEISEDEYNKAIKSLELKGITIENRPNGLSKYGRLIERLREEK